MTKHDYHWTFGNHCHIEFVGGGDPVVATNHAFNTFEGCAAWSDGAGNLRCYTDGTLLYQSLPGPPLATTPPTLGGTSSSAHAAIIVPPAGGGMHHHIFAVGDWSTPAVGPVFHTTVAVGTGVSVISQPTGLTAVGPKRAAEKLAAVPHEDCSKYWVVAIDGEPNATGQGFLYALLVDSDAAPSYQMLSPVTADPFFCIKFSPDGRRVAVTTLTTIEIYDFNRVTGQATLHSQVTNLTGNNRPYGVEFSPNGLYLYFSCHLSGAVRRHVIGSNGTFSGSAVIDAWPANTVWPPDYRIGALQLGPNGKIYGAKHNQRSLFEIGAPDSTATTGNATQFKPIATQAASAGGGDLTLNLNCQLGLPTFTRIADDCQDHGVADDRCAKLAAEVDEMLGSVELHNSMLTCEGEPPMKPQCEPVDIPPLEPQVYISWGDSKCDCIEGDDTEIMHITVCNPYKNVTLSNLVVSQIVVLDSNGNPVPNLPNGDPSIELVPIGPYCFDDIAPCTCVTREFILWLRGAPGGTYHIEIKGICFDACFHGDADACFQFEVCKD